MMLCKNLLSLLLAAFVFAASPTLATNDEVVECTAAQTTRIFKAIQDSDFTEDYQNIADDMRTVGENVEILYSLIEDVSAIQSDWWGDVSASFPSCALAIEVALTGGRMLDELLIAVSIGRVAYTEIVSGEQEIGETLLTRFQYHVGQWSDFQDVFLQIIEDAST